MSETESRHATVKGWSGGPRTDYDDLLATEPDEFELPIIPEDTYHVPHEDHVVLADSIENHGRYAFDMDAETAAVLYVETSDHYHDTIEGYTTGRPIEGGLLYQPENTDAPPFQTEIWGCIRMRVENAEDTA
ncbi:hypothetical protein [Natrinema gari]|uniref:Uncharacterized protein n=1 Tax=Natrinema gari JCM 14663 TaxID=1230459 RepID=L9ZJQ4_9EURY|nr:hypothetical protein [Natrinema gari]ELY85403.1 hypothetical protein C486_00140 [Natrinema gari JCM 14663]